MRDMGTPRRIGWLGAVAVLSLAASTLAPTTVAAAPASTVATKTVSTSEVSTSEVARQRNDGTSGTWQVESIGSGRYAVSWTKATQFPRTSDRPRIVGPASFSIDVSTIDADGRTVRAMVGAPTRPDPADLDVMLSGDRLNVPGRDGRRAERVPDRGTRRAPLSLDGTTTLGVDPGAPGPYAVTTSDYSLDPVKLPRMPEPIEMVGHVVEPSAEAQTGSRPLVLFLHGRHEVCYQPSKKNAYADSWPCPEPFKEIPSHLGYDYMQQVLASQGYTTVSIRVNGINAQDYALPDGGADARAAIIRRHLDHWVGLAASHQVDLKQVTLVGHSRGGEGVDRASIQIPLGAPYRIAGQVLIAPTNFGTQTAPYVPTVTLLPACDGDVSDLQGQRFTDTARDLAIEDTSLKSSVLVLGANHNYFNTEWTPGIAVAPSFDDWYGDKGTTCGSRDAQRLSSRGQRAVGTALVSGAVHLFARGEQAVLPLFDGSRARVTSQGAAQTLSHAIGGGREVRVPRSTTSLTLPAGARTRFCQGSSDPGRVSSCNYRVGYFGPHPHWPDSSEGVPNRPYFQMSWTSSGQSGGLALAQPLDLTGRRLEMRTIVDPKVTSVDLQVRLTDGQGHAALLTPLGGGRLPGIGDTQETRNLWAQSLLVDPSTAPGLDLRTIARVELVAASARGRVWISDLSSAPALLPTVPDERLPVVALSGLRIQEGDGPGGRTARVPFSVVGEVKRAARFSVLTQGPTSRDVQRFTIDLAPGQTSGTIPVGFTADRRDDLDEQFTQIAVWPVTGMMTDRYLGGLTVIDDDPPPRITLRPLRRRVVEGQPARWQAKLDSRVDYDLYLSGAVVRGRPPTVRGNDIAKSWIELYAAEADLAKPLWAIGPEFEVNLSSGERSVELSIPTRRDGVLEGPESLTVRLTQQDLSATSSVTVLDAR